MVARLDLKRPLKDLYQATQKVRRVEAGPGSFLAVEGRGAPAAEGDPFQEAIKEIYSVAYTLKFTLKKAGVLDFAVAPVETLWLDDPAVVPDMSQWRWRMVMRVPDVVTPQQVEDAKHAVAAKGGSAASVQLTQWHDGPCLQVMHIGPYDKVNDAYQQLHAAAEEHHVRLGDPAHEIYISDPRHTSPEKLRTIIRIPIAKE